MRTPTLHQLLTALAWAAAIGPLLVFPSAAVAGDEPLSEGIIVIGPESGIADIGDLVPKSDEGYGSLLTIPAGDFTCVGLNCYEYLNSAYSGALSCNASAAGNTCELVAPVYLPSHAEIASIFFLIRDNESSSAFPDMSFWLKRVDNYSGGAQTMTYLTSSGANSNLRAVFDLDPDYPIITYPSYNYYVGVRLQTTGHQLFAVLIYYS